MKPDDKIYNILNDKIGRFEPNAEPDWNVFKKKYQRYRFFKSKIRILALMLIGLTAVFSIIYFTTKESKPDISQVKKSEQLDNQASNSNQQKAISENKKPQPDQEELFIEKETINNKDNAETEAKNNLSQNAPESAIDKEEIVKENRKVKNQNSENTHPLSPKSKDENQGIEGNKITETKNPIVFDKKELAFQVRPFTSILGNYSFEEPFLEKYKKEDEASTNNFTSHFALRFSLTPEYTFRKEEINSAKQAQIHEDYTLIKAGSESGALSFSLGANLVYYATPQISFKTGLFYDRYSTSLNYSFTNEKIPVIDGKTNEILGYLTDTSAQQTILNQTNHYNYLQVPIVMEYFIPLNNKYELSLKGGAAFLFKTKSSIKTLNYSELVFDENTSDNFQSFNTGIILGVGLWDRSHQRFSYGIEPTYKFFLNSINRDETIRSKPYSFGIKTSFEINF